MKEFFFFGPPQVYGLLYRVLQEDRPTVRLYELADDDAVQFEKSHYLNTTQLCPYFLPRALHAHAAGKINLSPKTSCKSQIKRKMSSPISDTHNKVHYICSDKK